MPRYVDADKVIDVMKAAYWDENIHSAKDDPCVIDAMIDWSIRQVKNAPSEDVAPVIHGHWIYQGLSPYNCFSRCSCCDVVFDGYETLEYCPKCGAKMDEVVG